MGSMVSLAVERTSSHNVIEKALNDLKVGLIFFVEQLCYVGE